MTETVDEDKLTASKRSSDLWLRAFETLSDKDRQVNFAKEGDHPIVNEILKLAKDKQKEKLDSSWKYTRKDGTVVILREVLNKIVNYITKFQDAADFLVSLDTTGHAALPWASVKFFLSIAVKDSKKFGAVLDGMEFITREISYYGIFEVLYLRGSFIATEQLSDALVRVYSNILKYLSKARHYYNQRTLGRAISTAFSFNDQLDEIILAINNGRSEIERLRALIDGQIAKEMGEGIAVLNENQFKRQEELEQLLKDLADQKLSELKTKIDAEENECLTSLILTDPRDDLDDIKTSKGKRVEGTCKWLLAQKEYTAWLDGENPQMLRLIGAPGIGKTMISTYLVDELEKMAESTPNMTFAYYFCDNKYDKRKTATAIIRGLLLQLLRQHRDLFEHVQPDYKQLKGQLFDNIHALWRILLKILRDFKVGEIYLLVDALDECENSTRQALLDYLADLFTSPQLEGATNVKLLITCRPEDDIEYTLFNIGGQLHIDSAKVNDDLSEFIRVKVDILSPKKHYSEALKTRVQDALIAKAGGTFLWVSLVLASLKRIPKHQVEKELQKFPDGLYNVYDKILSQIEESSIEDAQFILRCMVAARRPLTKDEVAMAYAVELGGWTANSDLDTFRDVYKVCEPIVFIDNNNQTINLVHQSAKDYLLDKHLKENQELAQYHVVLDEANLLMFQICWKYLSIGEIEDDVEMMWFDSYWRLSPVPFSEESLDYRCFRPYTAQEWQKHALAASRALVTNFVWNSDDLSKVPILCDAWLLLVAQSGHEALVRLLLENGANIAAKDFRGSTALHKAAQSGHEAVVRLLLEKGADVTVEGDFKQTALHYAAQFGCEAEVQLMLDKGADVKAKNEAKMTALHYAARRGHEAIVRLLLEKGADIAAKDRDGRSTALHHAAWAGHEVIVRLLLDNGVDIAEEDMYRETALIIAIREGHEAVLRLLLEKGAEITEETLLQLNRRRNEAVVRLVLEKVADVAAKDDYRNKSLFIAAERGYEAVVLLLLEKGADIAAKNSVEETALHIAAQKGHEAIVRLLLDRGADFEAKDAREETALHVAAQKGHEAIVRLLLDRGADVTTKNCIGKTALQIYLATNSVHEAVVRLLLEKGTDITSMDNNGQTALHSEVWAGHETVVRLLLELGADVTANDSDGETALHLAAYEGDEAVMMLLLEKGSDVTAKNCRGKTVLQIYIATEYVRKAVVKLLLEKGADPDSKGEKDQMPLLWAAEKGHEEIVKLLLEKGANPNSARYGQTPLSLAAENGHEAIVKLLLEKAIDVDSKDSNGLTPLSWAAGNGHETVVKLLLDKAVEVDSKDNDGLTPLLYAAGNGYEAVTNLLLEKDADVDPKDSSGRTPLSWAAGNGHEAVVNLLLEKDADVDSKDSSGRTLLSWAAGNGHETVVKLLLDKAVEVDSKDNDGRTPLLYAAENGYEAVLNLLLEKDAEVDSKDSKGRTPLSWAAEYGHEAVVKLLIEETAEVDSKDSKGRSPLSWATEYGHEAAVKLLLEKAVDADSKDNRDQTPLLWAAKKGHEAVVKLLLEKAVDVNSKDNDGRTPLSRAAGNGHEAVVRLLLEKGADLETKDNFGQTPLQLADEHEAVMKLLLEKRAELKTSCG